MIFWMSSTAIGSTPGERLVQQDEARMARQRARDLHAAAFAAGQADRRAVAKMPDVQIVQQVVQRLFAWCRSRVPFSSSTACTFSATVSLRKIDASCGK